MLAFLFVLGCLLCGFGVIAMIMNLPEGCQNMSFKEALSEMLDNDKFTVSVLCVVIGALIVLFFLNV